MRRGSGCQQHFEKNRNIVRCLRFDRNGRMRVSLSASMRTRIDLLLLAKRFALFLGLWLVLAGAEGIVFGAAAAAAAVWASRALAPPGERPLRLFRLVLLAPGFLRRSLAGGIDVARRAFDPAMPMKPGWIAYPSRLPRGAARVVLGGEISLLPGTLVAGEEGDCLLVHCLDTDLPVARQLAEEEARLGGAVAHG
jgi:multicomponent Na+:H+ antiporter subunit E